MMQYTSSWFHQTRNLRMSLTETVIINTHLVPFSCYDMRSKNGGLWVFQWTTRLLHKTGQCVAGEREGGRKGGGEGRDVREKGDV